MLLNITIGAGLIFLTTAIHAGGMHLALKFVRGHVAERSSRRPLPPLIKVGGGWVEMAEGQETYQPVMEAGFIP